MKSHDLIGQRVTLEVHETPCRCIYPGCEVLEKTEVGKIVRFLKMPAGHIGFLETDDGRRICFDAELDIAAGKVEIVLPLNSEADSSPSASSSPSCISSEQQHLTP